MPQQHLLQVAIVIDSTCRGRFCPTVTDWFTAQARRRGNLDLDVIDLAKARLPDVLSNDGDRLPEQMQALAPQLAAADAFVTVTPEYNHSFPGPLKTAIDWYLDQWKAKPVAFVSSGGMSGGLRAIEQLRLVFAEVHTMTIRDTASFYNYPDQFGQDGHLVNPKGANGATKAMLANNSVITTHPAAVTHDTTSVGFLEHMQCSAPGRVRTGR
jgi:NAD(P)H-dependent FMN reductase